MCFEYNIILAANERFARLNQPSRMMVIVREKLTAGPIPAHIRELLTGQVGMHDG